MKILNLLKVKMISAGVLCSATALAQTSIGPSLIVESDLTVRVEHLGVMPTAQGPGFFAGTLSANVASPISYGRSLIFIDQNDGIYQRKFFSKGNAQDHIKIFDVANAPEGLTLDNRQSILNVATSKFDRKFYVAFTSATLPNAEIPLYPLPAPLPDLCCVVDNPIAINDLYRIGQVPEPLSFFGETRTEYQVIYQFKLKQDQLVEPKPIAAFEVQSGSIVHSGGGMLALYDGRIIFARGDSVTLGADGRFAPQDADETVGKILIVNPADGSVEVAAMGVRNVQRMQYAFNRRGFGIVFADIGGVTAEEVNFIPFWDLIDTNKIENFGWGRNADGLAREGTFYIDSGVALALALDGSRQSEPPVQSSAPSPEAGFIQPLAQWGRDDENGGAAASGPVVSYRSFKTITAMFTDLTTGVPLAVTDPLDSVNARVKRVNLINEAGESIDSFNALIGRRADARLFTFPNGKAGVILEATGDYYRLTEVTRK